MMSYEEKTNALGRPEWLFENLIFVIDFSNIFKYFLKLQKRICITFRAFGCFLEHPWMLRKSASNHLINLNCFDRS